MKLFINGRPTGSGVSQNIIRDATNYYAELLMREDSERIGGIKVNINLIPNLQLDYKSVGFCNWLDCPLRPDQFLIELDSSLSYKTMLISIGHEMTHVKQMAFGHRQEMPDGYRFRWMGSLVDVRTTHYYDLPWEVEAHGREYGLYDRYVNRESDVTPAKIIEPGKIVAIVKD